MSAACAVVLLAGGVSRASQDPQPAPPEGYAYAEACKTCHADIYKAWSLTKHARTINRLSAENQAKDCIGCHTTGPGGKIEKDGKFVNSNVQCESCHGKAAAHVADPKVKTGMMKKPSREMCTACHNDKSPHFRGFYYEGMLGFSHPVPKS
jgi:hypothetical protein